MNITIIAVGKMKEKYLQSGVEEYRKRLSRYCNLHMIEVADEKAPDHLSENEMIQVKDREGERLLKHVREGMHLILLDIGGDFSSSEAFASRLNALSLQGTSQIGFIIGGSLGVSQAVKQRADDRLSFSPMTFPHQLMRVILLEQIYRSYRINRNEPYHK